MAKTKTHEVTLARDAIIEGVLHKAGERVFLKPHQLNWLRARGVVEQPAGKPAINPEE